MGIRYLVFRVFYEFQIRTGLLRMRFPVNPKPQGWITLSEWKERTPAFFYNSRNDLKVDPVEKESLRSNAERIMRGELQFFNGEWKKIPLEDWLTNSSSGHVYSNRLHWTQIPDFDPSMGDIKYVWEKSRFGFLQTILRFDAAWKSDSSDWVFSRIDSWIANNPVNQGPNYRCSQETSLRVFNWTLALYFYKDSIHLTAERFEKIIFSIYWQLRHIKSNIQFSRIAVRNNHAITETLALYTAGLLFPFFKESSDWKRDGKKWFEEEILYQIYEDGTYLQFSFNYHRVVIQLLTWAFSISRIHKDSFRMDVYQRAHQSLKLLTACQDQISGALPNYGANDGSLFFNWNDSSFRDFRPALDALHYALTETNLYQNSFEDRQWFGVAGQDQRFSSIAIHDGTASFTRGGIYTFRSKSLLIFIVCVNYRDRPSQADNLHMDVWYQGNNFLRDAGSYRYNTDASLVKYFFGTESHNTVMLGDSDQMEKGPRFIWFGWSKAIASVWSTVGESSAFEGSVAMTQKGKAVIHKRRIEINASAHSLTVIDKVQGNETAIMRQLWHIDPRFKSNVDFSSDAPEKNELMKYYSPTYGVLEDSLQIEFRSDTQTIETKLILR